MNTVVIIPNINKDVGLNVTSLVTEKMLSLGFVVYLERKYASTCVGSTGYTEFPTDADIVIAVGGDGTVLDASKYAIRLDIPILCVNLGKVGYLSEIEPDRLDLLEKLKTGDYSVNQKMMLEISVADNLGCANKFAVNDVVISHDSYLGIADIKLEDSVGNMIKYRADGLILSTPQGSTAYSLSAGGPIVAHDVESIIATPVCAHSFFDRSVVFNASESIRVTNVSSDTLNISVDGRYIAPLKSSEHCVIKRSDTRLKMIGFTRNRMFSNLFRKMKMLEDSE